MTYFEPVPGRWRFAAVAAADDTAYDSADETVYDTAYEVVLTDGAGRERRYPFTAKVMALSKGELRVFGSVELERETLWDRAAYKAAVDAVVAFHHARERLGDLDRQGSAPLLAVQWRLAGIAVDEDLLCEVVFAGPAELERRYTLAAGQKPALQELGERMGPDSAVHGAVTTAVEACRKAYEHEFDLRARVPGR